MSSVECLIPPFSISDSPFDPPQKDGFDLSEIMGKALFKLRPQDRHSQHVKVLTFPGVQDKPARYTHEEKFSLMRTIEATTTLEHGWDGYAARPISMGTAKEAVGFLELFPLHLPLPRASWSADDEILLLWEKDGDLFSLSFYGQGAIYGYRRKEKAEIDYGLYPFDALIEKELLDMDV